MDEKMSSRTESEFPTGRPEFWCLGISAVLGILLTNFLLFGGFRLGFALIAAALILFNGIFLLCRGHRLTFYSAALLVLSLVICGSFARTDDGFVKFILLQFLMVSAGLGLSLLAGKNRWNAGRLSSLLDAPRALFGFGFGQIGTAVRGLHTARTQRAGANKKHGAVFIGLGAAIPLLAIVIPLLMRSDAAFEGLMELLPDFDFAEFFVSLLVGVPVAWVLYTHVLALHHLPGVATAEKETKTLPAATVNAVLGALCGVYFLYLFSQLAYIFGGFSGILPAEYTFAEYARRGFFEMAWLCAINLTVMVLAVGFTKKQGKVCPSTRWLCLFVGLATLFFVVAACAKMLLYIDVYGLTRLRVLTQVILVFMGITTMLVCVWLFAPKFAYMKPILLVALILGAGVAWADVDTVVAKYNVTGYLEGRLETVDTSYLGSLGAGAVPQLAQLAESAPDDTIRREAQQILNGWYLRAPADFREWDYCSFAAQKYLPEAPQDVQPDISPEVGKDPEPAPAPFYPDSTGFYAITPVNGCICLEAIDAATEKSSWYMYLPYGELMGPFETENALRKMFPGGTEFLWMELEGTEIWTQGPYRSFRGKTPDGEILLWLMDTNGATTYGPFRAPEEYAAQCKASDITPPLFWMDLHYYIAG